VTRCNEYTDPRLVALYDTVCPFGRDTAFYLELASELKARTMVDLGCGTGRLTCELSRRGGRLTGVDPSPTMLDVARGRPGGQQVRWIEGESGRLDGSDADLLIMTGHVAQVITDETGWHDTLSAIHRTLRPGGHVAFESRHPTARDWAAEKVHARRRRFVHPVIGPFDMWQQDTEVHGNLVGFELHYLLADTGEELVSTNQLRFRSEADLTDSLLGTGFSVEHVFGDWDRRPVRADSPELIYVARRAD
jgi:ubiquinone/menaquinone biosynthesis C-methylase UbiE